MSKEKIDLPAVILYWKTQKEICVSVLKQFHHVHPSYTRRKTEIFMIDKTIAHLEEKEALNDKSGLDVIYDYLPRSSKRKGSSSKKVPPGSRKKT